VQLSSFFFVGHSTIQSNVCSVVRGFNILTNGGTFLFQLTLVLEKIPRNQSNWSTYTQEIPRLSQDTPSESSEAEWSEIDSAEEGWESGEYTTLVRQPVQTEN
jgi:hypothetical protein